jgi:DNA-binding response OmpR family regulator
MRSPLVLLVEDEALIAFVVMDDLESAGYRVAGPFNRCADAMHWLDGETPDVAIIDIHLRDGSSAALADALRRRGVPFIVFSGERRDGRVAGPFESARWLGKPASSRQMLETVEELVLARGTDRARTRETGAPALAL